MITAIIRNKENTLVLELPHSIYDIYEKLQSIGIMQSPKRIPLTDNEGEDIGVKLFSESDFGQHLLLTLNEKNTIADANMLTLVIGAASEDIKEELEQNILYDQYGSMDEVISAIRQMTQDAGPVKAVFFCPLVGNIDEGDGDMFTVGDSYLADSADEIADALKRYTANDENDMATYYNEDDGVSQKLTSAVWSVEMHGDRLFGRIDCSLKEALTAEETEALRDWLTGQCSDGLCEGFEQQPIEDTVSYKNLTVGKEYTVKGILMDKATGKPFLVNGKEVTSKVTFTAEKKDGEITVRFTFDGSAVTKQTDIVVFEALYRDDVEIAAHADIEDGGQTVTLTPPAPPVPQTGDNSNLGFWIGFGAVALGGIIAVVIIRVKSRKDEDDE